MEDPASAARILRFYRQVATRLYPYRWVFWALSALAAAAFVAIIFLPGVPGGPEYAFYAIVVLLWSQFLILVVGQFAAPLPTAPPGARFFARVKVRIRRGMLFLAALFATAAGFVVVYFTVRAIGLLLQGR